MVVLFWEPMKLIPYAGSWDIQEPYPEVQLLEELMNHLKSHLNTASKLINYKMFITTCYTICSDSMPPYRVHSASWLTTDETDCSSPQKCFGCCYNYPPSSNCGNCKDLNDIVIKCSKFFNVCHNVLTNHKHACTHAHTHAYACTHTN